MTRTSLDQAQTIVSAALKEGRSLCLKPLSVAVLDAGGHMFAFAREDGSSNLRPQIATAKASARWRSACRPASSAKWRSSVRRSSALPA